MLCEALTLDSYYDRATGRLSGGIKRKLMLATALIGAVEVVFLDVCFPQLFTKALTVLHQRKMKFGISEAISIRRGLSSSQLDPIPTL